MNTDSPKFLQDVQWTEPLKIQIEKKQIFSDYNEEMVAFGSCLAQNIQGFFRNFRMPFWFNRDICAHYSAKSLLSTLTWLKNATPHSEDELHFYKEDGTDVGSYRYFRMRCYGEDAKDKCLKRMSEADADTILKIKGARRFLITIGTSFVAHHPETNHVMCTMFGIPTSSVNFRLYDSEEVAEQLEEIYSCLAEIRGNANFELITTLSPQRYGWQNDKCGMDPMIHNSLVKSINRVALHNFAEKYENVTYYPSYEIVMDELRLYESLSNYDHLHINRYETPGYVSKRFLQTFCSENLQRAFELMERMNGAFETSNFRISNGDSPTATEVEEPWKPILSELRKLEQQIACEPMVSRCRELLDRINRSDLLEG